MAITKMVSDLRVKISSNVNPHLVIIYIFNNDSSFESSKREEKDYSNQYFLVQMLIETF